METPDLHTINGSVSSNLTLEHAAIFGRSNMIRQSPVNYLH